MIPEVVIPEINFGFEIITILPAMVCANEEPMVECCLNLCASASCDAFPEAVCKIDTCGECSVLFTDRITEVVVDCGKRTENS